MPFSLKVALDVFQTKRDHTFEGCKGVVGIADEIAVFGKINEEHDRNMHATALSRSFVPAPFAWKAFCGQGKAIVTFRARWQILKSKPGEQ